MMGWLFPPTLASLGFSFGTGLAILIGIAREDSMNNLIETAIRYMDMAEELREQGQIEQAEILEMYARIIEEEATNA
jgi:hypothetical protein